MEQGRFHITYDFIGNIFRTTTKGSSPGNSGLMDQIYNWLGSVSDILTQVVFNLFCVVQIALPLWRRDVDSKVKKHAPKHHDYLDQKQKDGTLKL